jgi:fatty acid desaturase
VAILSAVAVPFVVGHLATNGEAKAAEGVLIVSWLATVAILLAMPESWYASTRLEPVISHRATLIGRVTYLALLYGVVSAVDLTGLGPGWHWFVLYWIVPLFTSFPLFMMLRQWVQHGNADRGRYTNTRVFLSGPLVRYAVFPWGMDYHLPHHLMASVPHYNLKRLHELMLRDPAYREKGVVLHGFFLSGEEGPSALAALGPDHAPATREKAYVDNAALEYAELRDAAGIAREAARSEDAS